MAMPKSVTKINKHGVTYISEVDRVSYTLQELTRAALRDVAKLLRNYGKRIAPADSGAYKSSMATWVKKDRRTGEIALHFGIYASKFAKKKNKKVVVYAHILEFGSAKMPAQKILTRTVYDNIDEIQRIEGKYLSAIENENKAISLIDEEEEIKDEI